MPNTNTPDISVVIVSYKCLDVLRLALDALHAAADGIDVEVFVVDNASGDGTTSFLRSHYPWVKSIDAGGNLGFSKANNIALEQCKGRVVLVLNPDTIVPRHFLRSIITHFDEHPEDGAVGVKMVNAHGEYLKESKRGYPDIHTSFFKLSGFWKMSPKSAYVNSYYVGQLSADEVGKAPILSGACVAFSHELMDRVGFFDPSYFMYGEDIDLSWRFNEASSGNIYRGDIQMIHFKGVSTPRKMKYIHSFYNAMLLFAKRYEEPRHNFLVNAIVAMGIRLGFLVAAGKCILMRNFDRIQKPLSIKRLAFVSNADVLSRHLPHEVQLVNIEGIGPDCDTVVFDITTQDIDSIINYMSSHPLQHKYGFYSHDADLCLVYYANKCHVLYDGKNI